MNKTKIEWVKNPDGTQGYTWNPLTGCLNHTPEGLCLGGLFPCYAFKLANGRLKQRYLANRDIANVIQNPTSEVMKGLADPFYPRFWPEKIEAMLKKTQGKIWPENTYGIFVCDMGELFGDWVPREWQDRIFDAIKQRPRHRFYLLTKQPQNLIKFSPFPSNCYVGVTATDRGMWFNAMWELQDVRASVKFISFEPLLDWEHGMASSIHSQLMADWFRRSDIKWVIIGACTGTKVELVQAANKIRGNNPPLDLALMPYGKRWTLQPKIEWVEEIVRACDKAGVKVFLKDNLHTALPDRKPFCITTYQGIPNAPDFRGIAIKTKLRQELPR